jgi:hypothetical protein
MATPPPAPTATTKQNTARSAARRGTIPQAHPAAIVSTSGAYDGGNSGSTLVIDETLNVVSQPSAWYGVGENLTSINTYKDGSGSTIRRDGQFFYTGKSAIEVGKESVQWTGGDPNTNKPGFAPFLFPTLVAAAHPKAREIEVDLYGNVHQTELIDPMSKALMGEHVITVLDSDTVEGITKREVLIRVHLEKVLLEEIGAIVNASSLCHAGSNTPLLDPTKPNAVLGFGGKTFNVAIFQGSRAILEPQAISLGGWNLINAISTQSSLKQRLAKVGCPVVGAVDVSLIKEGLESGTFEIGLSGISFRPEYNALLEPVLVRPALNHATNLVKGSNVDRVLVSGGCSLAPGLVDLVSASYPGKVVSTGMGPIDNARGLAIRAVIKRRQRLGK